MGGVNSLRNDLFKFFKTVAEEIAKENENILAQADKISKLKAAPQSLPSIAKDSSTFWLALVVTLGVILLLGALIIGPILCCLKKRGAFSSEHVDEFVDFPDDEEDQRSPKQLAVSPAYAVSPGRHGASPVARTPKSPRPGMSPARTPRTPRTPTRKVPRGLSPMGLSPMKNRSY